MLSREPPDARTLRLVPWWRPHVILWTFARLSLMVTCGPPDTTKWALDATCAHRTRMQKVCQTHDLIGCGAPDASGTHQTRTQRGLQTARTLDSHHRTHPEHPVLVVRNPLPKSCHTGRMNREHPASGVVRPMLNPNRARHWQHTSQRLVPPRTASGEWETLPWLPQISHQRNRKYTLNFLKSAEEPKSLSTLGTPPSLQMY